MSIRPAEGNTFQVTPSTDPVDDAYNAFETAWRNGARPRIEDYLDVAPEKQRRDFLEALFYLELDYRQRFDDLPTPREYLDRFPGYADLVRQVFDDALISLGEYRVLEKVGEGGMGKVFKARHSTMNRVVALKVLPKSHTIDPQAVARFRQEVEIVARLSDPHVVQAYDAGSSRGTHFLVMEFVDGLDLASLIRLRGPIPIPLACDLIRQAAIGLSHAHEHGIVHRDVKPSNLILNTHGVVKLLDLGLARRKFDETTLGITNPGAIMGTADYMAPEQWDSARTVDIRADIYSLGCTLYYLLAGWPPYGDKSNSSFQQKMRAHAASPIPDIRERRPDCTPELCEILSRLMAKDASQRYATPAEVAAVLAPLSNGTGLKELVAGTLDYETIRIEAPSSGSQPPGPVGPKLDTDTSTNETLATASQSNIPAANLQVGPNIKRLVLQAAIFAVVVAAFAAVFIGPRFIPRVPADAPQIRQRLATMSGLNGGWWFEETPWLVPSVRAELLAAIQRGDNLELIELRYLSRQMHSGRDVTEVYDRLKQMSEKLVKERFKGAERTLLLDLFSNDPEQLSDEKFNQLLAETRSGLAALQDPSAEQLHLRAVLCHYQADWEEADEAYKAAQTAYEKQSPEPSELYALLLSDYGRMLTDRGSMQSSSLLSQAAHESRNFQAPAFRVSLLGQQAESKQRDGALEEALAYTQEAVTLAESALTPDHPLLAAAYEKRSWVRLDQYRFSLAQREFGKAALLRERELSNGKNHRALRYLLHDRQGEYMCEYFLGNHSGAIADLRTLITERFDKPLDAGELTEKERRELVERLPNTWERLGDCYLLGSRDFAEAAEVYETALEKAGDARWDHGRLLPDLIRIRYKLAGALALSDSKNRADAHQAFDRAEPPAEAARLNEKQKRRYLLAREVARSRLALDEDTPEKRLAGFKALGEILSDPTPLLREPDSVNRDDLSLLLLAAHVFFESDTIATEMPAARQELLGDVANSIVRLCHDPLRESSGELDAFIKPYLDSVRAALEASLKETDSPMLKEVLEKLNSQSNGE